MINMSPLDKNFNTSPIFTPKSSQMFFAPAVLPTTIDDKFTLTKSAIRPISAVDLFQKFKTEAAKLETDELKTPEKESTYTSSDTATLTKPRTENSPTYMTMLDGMESNMKYWLPWDDAQSLSGELNRWGDTRDGALRVLDGSSREREFGIDSLQNSLSQIALKKEEIQRAIDQKKAEQEAKKKEMEAKQEEIDRLKKEGSNSEIDSKIKDLDSKAGESQSKISSKEDQIAKLKEEIEKNPDKKDENQKKIDELKGEVSEEKSSLEKTRDQKKELETKKQENDKKAEENKRKKEELEAEKAKLREELREMRKAEASLNAELAKADTSSGELKEAVNEKKAELDRLNWLISDFTFKTQGMD